MYRMHHNGHANRYKVRYRSYAESNTGFLEVKFRNNKGRMKKERIRQEDVPMQWSQQSLDFISTKTPYDPTVLKPSLWVKYQRITLVGKNSLERVTIDLNLEFMQGPGSRKINNLVIAEIKQSSRAKTAAGAIMKELKIRQDALSKYCMGIIQMYPQVKKNNFKEQVNLLNKLIYDTSFNTAAGS
jgi:hypothetical protein